MVTNRRLGPEPVAFGSDNATWKDLIAQMQPGDELWQFASDAQSWRDLAGRAGISLVRNGEIVISIVTIELIRRRRLVGTRTTVLRGVASVLNRL